MYSLSLILSKTFLFRPTIKNCSFPINLIAKKKKRKSTRRLVKLFFILFKWNITFDGPVIPCPGNCVLKFFHKVLTLSYCTIVENVVPFPVRPVKKELPLDLSLYSKFAQSVIFSNTQWDLRFAVWSDHFATLLNKHKTNATNIPAIATCPKKGLLQLRVGLVMSIAYNELRQN